MAWIRLFFALFFFGYNGVVFGATIETFWMFLTNLTYIVVTATYIMLIIGHCQRGDFRKSKVVDKDPPRGCCSKHLWQLISGCYEFSVHMTLTVFIAFWAIEFPGAIYV